MKQPQGPKYGSWVPKRIIITCAILAAVLCMNVVALRIYARGYTFLRVIFTAAALGFIAAVVYFLYARRLFSPAGGDIQTKVLGLLTDRVDWNGNGRALDIGCGNGALIVQLAKKYPDAKLTAMDLWGDGWDYSQKQCEENAELEGVADRMEFIRASAAKMPFDNSAYDLVVSNMTFHEVGSATNKLPIVKEALRVLKKGKPFVFQDLFYTKAFYGTPDELVDAVKAMGVREVHLEETYKSEFIPAELKPGFMLGKMGMLWGVK